MNIIVSILLSVLGVVVSDNGVRLHGARGKIYNVDRDRKSFELLTSTSYDPVSKEGQSRFTVHWCENTRFFMVERIESFADITGPVVADFHYLDEAAAQAVREGRRFSAPIATLHPEAGCASGLREDGKKLLAWFSPDPNSTTMLDGTADINGSQVPVTLNAHSSVVYVQRNASEDALETGLFSARIFCKEIEGRFLATRIELYPRKDPRQGDNPKLPRVLVVGDSISMNYHEAAKAALEGKTNYHRIEGNGGPTERGVENMELWLGNYTVPGLHWDVILFNHGLHDLKQGFDSSRKSWGEHHVGLEKYQTNLEKEIEILAKTGAKLIWCTTTPVPNNSKGRFARRKDEDLVFNEAADEVVARHPDIHVLDLNALVRSSSVYDSWRKGNDVHFHTDEERQVVGAAVAKAILQALEK